MGLNELFSVCAGELAPEDVKVVFDLGSRDCLEAVEFAKRFPNAKIYSFECHPESIKTCLRNSAPFSDRITVVQKAVNSYTGTCKFFPIDPEKTVTTWVDGNPGASSLYKSAGTYDHIEKYVQNEIEVECVRLDEWAKEQGIEHVDLVWCDLQGAELLAFQCMGDLLKTTKVIHTEMEVNPMYEGQSLYKDIHPLLVESGFKQVWGNAATTQFGSDFIYVNATSSEY